LCELNAAQQNYPAFTNALLSVFDTPRVSFVLAVILTIIDAKQLNLTSGVDNDNAKNAVVDLKK
jgi:hypothetical protein